MKFFIKSWMSDGLQVELTKRLEKAGYPVYHDLDTVKDHEELQGDWTSVLINPRGEEGRLALRAGARFARVQMVLFSGEAAQPDPVYSETCFVTTSIDGIFNYMQNRLEFFLNPSGILDPEDAVRYFDDREVYEWLRKRFKRGGRFVDLWTPAVQIDALRNGFARFLGKAAASGVIRLLSMDGADLSGVAFARARLYKPSFKAANLSGAQLSDTNLVQADFTGANLEEANMFRSHLDGAIMRAVRMRGAVLRGVSLEGTNFTDADLEGARLAGVLAAGAVFAGASLRAARLRRAILRDAKFTEACLDAADLRNTVAAGADFSNAKLRRASLYRAQLSGAAFIGADLESANLRQARLSYADFEGANLRNADLRGVDLYGSNLRNADLRGALLKETNLKPLYHDGIQLDDGIECPLRQAPREAVREFARQEGFAIPAFAE